MKHSMPGWTRGGGPISRYVIALDNKNSLCPGRDEEDNYSSQDEIFETEEHEKKHLSIAESITSAQLQHLSPQPTTIPQTQSKQQQQQQQTLKQQGMAVTKNSLNENQSLTGIITEFRTQIKVIRQKQNAYLKDKKISRDPKDSFSKLEELLKDTLELLEQLRQLLAGSEKVDENKISQLLSKLKDKLTTNASLNEFVNGRLRLAKEEEQAKASLVKELEKNIQQGGPSKSAIDKKSKELDEQVKKTTKAKEDLEKIQTIYDTKEKNLKDSIASLKEESKKISAKTLEQSQIEQEIRELTSKIESDQAIVNELQQRVLNAESSITELKNFTTGLQSVEERVMKEHSTEEEECFICFNTPDTVLVYCGHNLCTKCLKFLIDKSVKDRTPFAKCLYCSQDIQYFFSKRADGTFAYGTVDQNTGFVSTMHGY